ncbi:MAG TPA: nuclear transport factor 2 family protein [Solirubrobacteraceae bacterium]
MTPRIPIKRTATLILAPLLASGVVACGSTVSTSSFKGPSQAVAKRIAEFQSDVTAGEKNKLCNRDFASAVQARLRAAGGSCVEALKNQLGAIDDYELTVKSIAVHGTNATASVKTTWSGKQRLSTLLLVKEGGSWKIASLQ